MSASRAATKSTSVLTPAGYGCDAITVWIGRRGTVHSGTGTSRD